MTTASRDVPPCSLWAFTDHRTQAQVSPFQQHVDAKVIEARRILWDANARPSLRKLAAQVIGRWGMQ